LIASIPRSSSALPLGSAITQTRVLVIKQTASVDVRLDIFIDSDA
jgi:hypothetical protein